MTAAALRPADSPLATTLLVLGAAIGMLGGFAVVFSMSFGIFMKPISADLNWARTQVSLLSTMGFLGYVLGAPVLGILNDRYGARRLLAIGVIVFAAGVASLGVLPAQLPVFAAVCLCIGFAGAATAPSGYILILSKFFDRRLGLAIGLAMFGLGLGAATMPVLAQTLIQEFGWRGAYLALGALALACGAAALIMGIGRGSDGAATAVGAGGVAVAVPPGASVAQALRSWRFWLIALSALLVGGSGFGVSAHLAAILSDRGMDAALAARIVGLLGAGIFIARVGTAVLMDRFFAPAVAMVCCLLGGLGLYLIESSPAGDATLLLWLGPLLTGLLVGSEGDIMPFLTRRYFGLASFGSIYGCILGIAGLGGILGPLLFGMVFDAVGSYTTILLLAAVLCAASGPMMLLLGPYRYRAASG